MKGLIHFPVWMKFAVFVHWTPKRIRVISHGTVPLLLLCTLPPISHFEQSHQLLHPKVTAHTQYIPYTLQSVMESKRKKIFKFHLSIFPKHTFWEPKVKVPWNYPNEFSHPFLLSLSHTLSFSYLLILCWSEIVHTIWERGKHQWTCFRQMWNISLTKYCECCHPKTTIKISHKHPPTHLSICWGIHTFLADTSAPCWRSVFTHTTDPLWAAKWRGVWGIKEMIWKKWMNSFSHYWRVSFSLSHSLSLILSLSLSLSLFSHVLKE